MDYIAAREGAADKLKAAGQLLVLRVPASGTFTAATGGLVAGTPTDYSVYGIEVALTQDELKDSGAQVTKRKFIVAALTSAGAVLPQPTTKDALYLGSTSGTRLAIDKVDAQNPAGTAVYYEVVCHG